MKAAHNPFDVFFTGAELARIGLESQAVIAMRVMGMMGFWATRPNEMSRMLAEKPEAFAEGWMRGAQALMRGAPPAAVVSAAIAPIGRRTGANHRRLSRLGPRGICG